jgi:hypothetical protein
MVYLWDISDAALKNVAGKIHFSVTFTNYRT